MDNIQISTIQEVDISLQSDDIDYIVLNDGVTELQSAIKDIVSDDKLTVGIITAVGDTKYQPIGDYVTESELALYKEEIDNLIGDINNELASI